MVGGIAQVRMWELLAITPVEHLTAAGVGSDSEALSLSLTAFQCDGHLDPALVPS